MDNLGSHKSTAVRRMIEAQGAKLRFLPPYHARRMQQLLRQRRLRSVKT